MGRERVGTAFPHLFHVCMSTSLNTPSLLFQNELEAVLKRLDFLVRSHTSFVDTTSLARSKFAPRVRT